ncbi:MAG: molybdopterin-dependent oxidoreductase [Candidatus Saccharicenans sp.]|nr:molybdopterin-dependent oxidoreductase [Candidatus Saccharicenans sp.]
MSYERGLCNFCGTGCGHLLLVEDNRPRGVYPLPGHPLSRGRLCVRGWHIHELLQTPERITEPLVRDGNGFRQVSYQEALAFTAEKLRKFAGEEIAFLGSPRVSNEENYLFGKFARAVMKSNNLSLSSDAGLEESAEVLLAGCGWPAMTASLSGLREADFILVAGGDLTRQNPIIASEIHLARRAGAFVVTISPRKTQMAKLSRMHLRPEPGTAFYLLLGIARMMLDEGLVEREFVESRIENASEYMDYLLSLNIGEIFELTGVDSQEAATVARRLAEANSAYGFYTVGIQSLDRRTIAALFNLFLQAGKVGRNKGGICPVTGISNLLGSLDMGISPRFLPGYLPAEDESSWKKLEELWRTSLVPREGKSVASCLLDNPELKALVVVDHDEEIIRNTNRIKQLELVVYFGSYENAFSRLAHVIFPRTTYIEDDGTFTSSERRVQLSRKKVEPPAGVRPLRETLSSLAVLLGHNWKYPSPEEVMKEINRVIPWYSEITYRKLEDRAGIKWPVDELHPEGSDFLKLEELSGKLSFVVEHPGPSSELPDLTSGEKFHFKLVVGRSNYFWHQNSIMKRTFIPRREYNALLLLYPKGFVEVSEEDARALGLREKQQVKIISEKAEVTLAVRISPDILPGMLYIPYFFDEMIPEFLHRQVAGLEKSEEFFLPVNLEKVV